MTDNEMMDNATMDNKDFVSMKSRNGKYNTVQVDLKALPFVSDGEFSRVWVDGNEIRNITSVAVNASTSAVTEVTITFKANVAAVGNIHD